MIALLTDSNSQLPAALIERYSVTVIPFTIVIDGKAYREGVDLSLDEFYDRLGAGAEVSTAAPPPGEMVAAYKGLAEAGADAVLAIHIGSSVSATVSGAHIAAAASPVPVEIVDTDTASFAVGCCVWAAGEVLAAGGDLAAAAAAARRVASSVGNVFIVGALDLARRGGRLAVDVDGATAAGLPVLALQQGTMGPVGTASDIDEATKVMAAFVAGRAEGRRLRAGVGQAKLPDAADRLAARLEELDLVDEVVRYDVGPSVGVHTGPGTLGAVFFPSG